MLCKKCQAEIAISDLEENRYICPNCGFYFRISSKDRIRFITDQDSFEEWFEDIEAQDDLWSDEYREKLLQIRKVTGFNEAVIVGKASVLGKEYALGVCESQFLMGSMGYIVGEKITRMIEKATEMNLPVFLFTCSGGARMQEGLMSLMQMEKTAAAIAKHSAKGLFYCPIITDPTTGGVTASFAMLGDVIMAEPGATIGFTGKRVIEQTIGQQLPEDFQTAEFAEAHGMIDGIVERKNLRKVMLFMILAHSRGLGDVDTRNNSGESYKVLLEEDTDLLPSRQLSKWERIQKIRSVDFPSTLKLISKIFDIFVELKGDRTYRDDPSVVGGIALLEGIPVTVITEFRGYDMDEAIARNFGMPMPEGYRKARRLMKQAEKFHRPVITFINTPGAYCGVEAEERNQGEAIAGCLYELSQLKVPVLSIIVGEAGSGGALALAVGNEVWMFENAIYSILTPEGYASIVWKDASRAKEAAERMKITAEDLIKQKIIDKIIPETEETVGYLKKEILRFFERKREKTEKEIVEERYQRFRRL